MLLFKNKKILYSKVLSNWLAIKKDKIKEQSYIKYQNLIETNIVKTLGQVEFKYLNESKINNFFNSDTISKLSLSTQRTLIYIIKNSIQYGVLIGLRNPLNNIDIRIKKPKAKITYLTKKEQIILENYLRNKEDIRDLGILICLYTGIRLGEICGLKWKDIDFVNQSLSINRTVQRIKNSDVNATSKTKKIISSPKSDSSKRTIPIPKFLLDLIYKFKTGDENYILTNSSSFKDTRVYEKYLENVLKRCGIRNLNFHTLRHTFATRSIESGMDIKTLSEILGHSSYHITLDVYVHSTIEQKRNCIDNLVNYINSVVEY